MKREVENKTILDKFAEEFVEIVEKHCKYIIVSGFVAIAHGRSRGTEDIDMIIENLDKEEFKKLFRDLSGKFECMQSSKWDGVYEYLENGDSVRFTKKQENLPEMEVKFAKDELDRNQLDNRKKLPFTGLDIYFSSIETNIAFKEELLKSDKDLEDAKHLRIIYEGKLDEDKIEEIKKKIREERLK